MARSRFSAPAAQTALRAPFLKKVSLLPERAGGEGFPFDLPILGGGRFELSFDLPVTFFVGENGTGKSTVLEAIAAQCGFDPGGGSQQHRYGGATPVNELARALRLSWLPKVTSGFYLRAESFFNFASYIDEAGNPQFWGDRSLHGQSHGESFLTLFRHRFTGERRSLYLLDEPEAALSPRRQIEFLGLLRQWERTGNAQFIIATHSPIILSYPNAHLFSFDGGTVHATRFEDTEHYRVTRSFLLDPAAHLAALFAAAEAEPPPAGDVTGSPGSARRDRSRSARRPRRG